MPRPASLFPSRTCSAPRPSRFMERVREWMSPASRRTGGGASCTAAYGSHRRARRRRTTPSRRAMAGIGFRESYPTSSLRGPLIRAVNPVPPGLLIAGLNPVNTDAVGAALMGFDPMAVRGTAPFETCDSTLLLAEQHGIGTRDLRRIEVIGPPISDVRLDYRAHRAARRG